MSTQNAISTVTVKAGSAVTRYRFVKRAADGKYDHVGTANIVADGIAADNAAADESEFPMVIPNGGFASVELGGAITDGTLVMSDNAGKAIAYVDSATNIALGRYAGRDGNTPGDGASGDIGRIQFMIIGSNAGV